MKKYLSSFVMGAVWLAASVSASPLETGLVARIHFAGGDTVAADPNAASLKAVWSGPEAQALRVQTVDKLSRFLDGWLGQQVAPHLAVPLQTHALLFDLTQAEWQLEVHQAAAGAVQFSLAVRLDNSRAQAWQTALNPVVAGWKQTSPAHHGQLQRKGDWVFLTLDNATVPAVPATVAGLNHQWLSAEVDWTRLAVWFPAVRTFDLPQTRLQVTGRNGNFETTGNLSLAQPLPSLPNWQFPTNLVHWPFVSFTAARGIANWLHDQPWVNSMDLNPLPNQVFTWVEPQIPFLAFAALPLANADAALPKIHDALAARLQAEPVGSAYHGFSVTTEPNKVALVGLPLIAPYVEARQVGGANFLVSGFLPATPRGKPAPKEIYNRLNTPNLIYFHWEVTAERQKVFPGLYQLGLVVTRHRQLEATSAAGRWLAHLAPELGPTVTTATEISPTEVAFERHAPGGLTAVELVALCSWLEAPNFPGCDLHAPPPRHRPRPAGAAAPQPFTLHP